VFDLVTGKARHLPSHSTLPIALSTTAQAAVAAAALALSALFVAERIPEIPTMLAFVAPPPPPPPPAPAPPPAQRPAPVKPLTQPQHVPSTHERVTPVEEPKAVEPEPRPVDDGVTGGVENGVEDGVEGGVPGGIVGGIVGGLPEPPPPPAPADHAPIRVGGQIQTPTLLHRVEPFYPPLAVNARLQGLVILEALVDRDGTVVDVKVLRSAGSVLDREALIAVRQWRYAPLVLSGQRVRFVLTVILSFALERVRENLSYAVRAK
jgi:protein TonB